MSSHVEQIKERLPIQDVIGSYIKIEKAGAALKARCPFHNEKTPSFFISPDRGGYYCFGCGAKGDIFSFVEQFENVDFRGALKILAERAGVTLTPENPKVLSEKDRLYRIMEFATKVYEKNLAGGTAAGTKPLEYIQKRGLTAETIAAWRVGFVPDAWSSLYDLLRKNATDAEIEKAGLIKKGESGNSFYDRFRGRIMFPFFDPSERVVAFSGRFFEGKDDSAKYLNSPETPLFHKSSLLYGYHKAKAAIRLENFALLVEGQMDLLMCHQSGFANTVATSGTSLTPEHLDIIKRLTDNLVIAFDGDAAGLRASTRAWEMALNKGMTVSILALPDGIDPADALVKDREMFAAALKARQHIIDFHLDHIVAKHPQASRDTEQGRALALAVKAVVVPYVAALESSIEQSHFVKKVADKANIDQEAVWKDVRAHAAKTATEAAGSTYVGKAGDAASASMADSIAGRMALGRRLSIPARAILGIVYWKDGDTLAAGMRERLQKLVGAEKLAALEAGITGADGAVGGKEELVFEAEAYYGGSAAGFEQDVEELFSNLEMDIHKQELERLMKELAVAEKAGDKEKVGILLVLCEGVSKKIAGMRKT